MPSILSPFLWFLKRGLNDTLSYINQLYKYSCVLQFDLKLTVLFALSLIIQRILCVRFLLRTSSYHLDSADSQIYTHMTQIQIYMSGSLNRYLTYSSYLPTFSIYPSPRSLRCDTLHTSCHSGATSHHCGATVLSECSLTMKSAQ